jgi:hypothetical protein
MEKKPQTLANHIKFDPKWHFFLAPLTLVVVGMCIWRVIQHPGFDAGLALVLSIMFLIAVICIRTYSLRVQDRVIRLEERLRLSNLLPERLRPRIGDFTESQLIALRFASDAELPALAEKTLNDKLAPKQIKQSIGNWRPDYFRV